MMLRPLARLGERARVGLRQGLTLANVADELAAIHGDAPAICEQQADGTERVLSHAEIRRTVAAWSAAVAERSEPGDPVVVATPNGVDQLMASLAVARAGRLPAPVNDQMTAAEVDHVIADCGASLVVRDVAELHGRRVAGEPLIDVSPPDRPEGDAVAALFYTSGTTGRPKGAELTHHGLVGHLSAAALFPPVLRGREVVMGLPVAHIMGFVALLGPLVMGVPVYFLPHFSPHRALDAIESRRASAFLGVPAMYRMLLEAGAEERDLSCVRVWMSGADVMPPELARRFKAMGATASLPGIGAVGEASFWEGYGMVEVAGGVALKVSPPGLPVGLGESLGMRLPGWHFKVIGESGDEVAPGEVGELLVRGPGVLKGYRGDASAGSDVLTDDGWLRTGDLVRRGPLGTVLFHGRSKHVIKSGGYSVYPVEVEADLEEHPDVAEAAVVGIEDPKLGEVPVAAVRKVRGSTVTEAELEQWAARRMARYKAPRRIVFTDHLPRTGTNKVRRDEVAALVESSGAD